MFSYINENFLNIKHQLFAAIAQYHASLSAEEEGKYGESVARMIVADSLIVESLKLCEKSSGAPQLL